MILITIFAAILFVLSWFYAWWLQLIALGLAIIGICFGKSEDDEICVIINIVIALLIIITLLVLLIGLMQIVKF